jgi:site-specific DNA-cytosine methylase
LTPDRYLAGFLYDTSRIDLDSAQLLSASIDANTFGSILFASDIDKAAIDTYKANFPATSCIRSDIHKINFSQILLDLGLLVGELDILIGDPPCQGFSTAGRKDSTATLEHHPKPRSSMANQLKPPSQSATSTAQ